MAGTTYICFPADPQINSKRNTFSIDGGVPRGIYGGANLYKLKAGNHKIVVKSGSGEQWEMDEELKDGKLLTIKVYLAGQDICNGETYVSDVGMARFGAIKLD